MTNEWDEYAADWDSNADVVLYSEKAFAKLCEVISPEGLRVLDFGCGTGLLTTKISKVAGEVVALDNSPAMIEVLKQKKLPGVRVVEALLTAELVGRLPLFSKPFDLIVASSVCAFLPNYSETVGLLSSLLAPAGLFVQWDWLVSNEKQEHGLTLPAVSKAFDAAKLQTVSLGPVFSFESKKGAMPVLMAVGKNG